MGAVVLGIGLGAFGRPLLLVGAGIHAWGMLDKHRLERQADIAEVWWEPIAYWICWGFLAILGGRSRGRPTDMI